MHEIDAEEEPYVAFVRKHGRLPTVDDPPVYSDERNEMDSSTLTRMEEPKTQFCCMFKGNHRPKIITLCGSTRFTHAFQTQTWALSLRGYIVLGPAMDKQIDGLFALSPEDKQRIDELHFRKIDLSDEIMVLNDEGYIGQSTEDEIWYAMEYEKRIHWLEPFVSIPINPDDSSLGRRNISTQEYLVQLTGRRDAQS